MLVGPKFKLKDPRIFRNDGRDIVVVDTPWGPKAFYKRTGGGGADEGFAAQGAWAPFNGFLKHSGPKGRVYEWMIKPPEGRTGGTGSDQISKFLADELGTGSGLTLGTEEPNIGALNAWLRSNGVEVGGGYHPGDELELKNKNGDVVTEIVLEIP